MRKEREKIMFTVDHFESLLFWNGTLKDDVKVGVYVTEGNQFQKVLVEAWAFIDALRAGEEYNGFYLDGENVCHGSGGHVSERPPRILRRSI